MSRSRQLFAGILYIGLSLSSLACSLAELRQGWLRRMILRLDHSTQKDTIVNAFEEFNKLCLCQVNWNKIPNLDILCALAASSHAVPRVGNSELCKWWKQELKKNLSDTERTLCPDDFTLAVQMFALLPSKDGKELLKTVEKVLGKTEEEEEDEEPDSDDMPEASRTEEAHLAQFWDIDIFPSAFCFI